MRDNLCIRSLLLGATSVRLCWGAQARQEHRAGWVRMVELRHAQSGKPASDCARLEFRDRLIGQALYGALMLGLLFATVQASVGGAPAQAAVLLACSAGWWFLPSMLWRRLQKNRAAHR